MAQRILITSGPTREYLDPVRFLSNASSGRMGAALARAVLNAGHQAVVVSGPVDVDYPEAAEVHPVLSTDQMLQTALRLLPDCRGVIGAAAPCDYRPATLSEHKLSKADAQPRLVLELVETPDILATLSAHKTDQWFMGFALETQDHRERALVKLRRKGCDWIVLNGPASLDSEDAETEVLDKTGRTVAQLAGPKNFIAAELLALALSAGGQEREM